MQTYRKYVSSLPFLGAAAFLALLPGVDAATGFFGVLGLVLGAIVRWWDELLTDVRSGFMDEMAAVVGYSGDMDESKTYLWVLGEELGCELDAEVEVEKRREVG
jgi:hypothetical protein